MKTPRKRAITAATTPVKHRGCLPPLFPRQDKTATAPSLSHALKRWLSIPHKPAMVKTAGPLRHRAPASSSSTTMEEEEEEELEKELEEDELGAQVLALASVFPSHCCQSCREQEEYLASFLQQHPPSSPEEEDFIRGIHRATALQACESFLPTDHLFSPMTMEEYTTYTRPTILQLALNAGRSALSQFGGQPSDVTHLILCTMTGNIQLGPSDLDCDIMKDLGLKPSVQHLHVENMTCPLSMAQDLALSRSRNVVLLLTCDLRETLLSQQLIVLHEDEGDYINSPFDRSTVVASPGRFRDSGRAIIVAHPHFKRYSQGSEGFTDLAIPPSPPLS